MADRTNEKVARHIVSEALGVPVELHDHGTADAQVDALIRLPDGDAALEIFSEHDDAFNSQWAALEKLGRYIEAPSLNLGWSARLSHRANVRRVRELLPRLISIHEAAVVSLRPRQELPDEFGAIGVTGLYPVDHIQGGRIALHPEGWSGSAGSGDIASWVVEQLHNADDVPRKLKAHPAEQKHAFIWTTIGTEFGIQHSLENREDVALPVDPPDLPDGVTHIWVVGGMSSQSGLAWFPDRGWWKVWDWPEGGLKLVD